MERLLKSNLRRAVHNSNSKRTARHKMSRGKGHCFFCDEKATVTIDLHHRIPQSIMKGIPRLVRREVLEEIFGKNAQRLYPLCGSCHKKAHALLKPFWASLLMFSDVNNPWKNVVNQKMKDKVLVIISEDGKQEDAADVERVISKLERGGVNREESIRLLRELRNDGPIYYVMPDDSTAKMDDPQLINVITFDYDGVEKARKRLKRGVMT